MSLPLIWCIYGGETWRLSNEKHTKNWLPGRNPPKEARPCSSRARDASGKAPSRRNSDDGTMRRICSSTSRKPLMTCWTTSSTCATTSTRSSCTCHPSTEWNCTGGIASSFSTRCNCIRRPARPSSSWWLTGVTTTSRRGRLSPSAKTSRTSSFHQRRSRSA